MSNKRVLLIQPRHPGTCDIISTAFGITPPLGIGYIASYLRQNDFEVYIMDNSIECLSGDNFLKYLKQVSPFLVGINVSAPTFSNALDLANLVKSSFSSMKVVMGGPHPSACPAEILLHDSVDFVVCGEGEITMLHLLQTLHNKGDLKEVQGIVYKDFGRIISNEQQPVIEDLNVLPLPAYDLMKMDHYFLPPTRRLSRGNVASMITSRGCVYECTYCSKNVFGKKVRFRSPENVVEEIKFLIKNYSVEEVIFYDDTFAVDKERVRRICSLIRKEEIKLKWSCFTRADCFDEDLCKDLFAAGCRLIGFGVESGNQDVLDSLSKGVTLKQIRDAVGICKRNKMLIACSFIIGAPNDTKGTVLETIKFACQLDPDFVGFSVCIPFPGTRLFDEVVEKYGFKIGHKQLEAFITDPSTDFPPFNLGVLSKEELIDLQKKAYRSFYFRPVYIFKRMLALRSLDQVYEIFRGINMLLKHQIHNYHSRV